MDTKERRVWRYHLKHPARIFEGDDAIKKAEADGWCDHPDKTRDKKNTKIENSSKVVQTVKKQAKNTRRRAEKKQKVK